MLLIVGLINNSFFAFSNQVGYTGTNDVNSVYELEKSIKEIYPTAVLNKLENLEGYQTSYQIIIDPKVDQ